MCYSDRRSDLELAYCLTDRGNAQNEDFVCVGRVKGSEPGRSEGLFGVLLDGATGLFPGSLFGDGWRSDAQWLSHTAGTALADELRSGAAVRDALARVVTHLQQRVSDAAGVPFEQVAPDAVPSCTLSVAVVRGGACSVFCLGDSPIVVALAGSETVVLRDERLVALDASAVRHMVERSAGRSLPCAERRALVADELRANRRLRNTEGGYWCFDPTGAGLDHLREQTFPAGEVRFVSAYSDGLFAADDTYGLVDLVRRERAPRLTELLSTIDRMRVVEAGDPDLERHPRLKPADDASSFQLLVTR